MHQPTKTPPWWHAWTARISDAVRGSIPIYVDVLPGSSVHILNYWSRRIDGPEYGEVRLVAIRAEKGVPGYWVMEHPADLLKRRQLAQANG